MNFDGKTLWITGASSGIGAALAKQLAARGATLILSARSQDKLEAVREACANSERHAILPLDIEAIDSFPAKVEAAISHTGHVDMLVNNAGISHYTLVLKTPLELDRKIMEVDYFGQVALTKALLPHFVERKSGWIIAVSSIAGKVATPNLGAYTAAKHALIGFMDSLRVEVYKLGIRVAVVCPGFVRTNVAKNSLDAQGNPLNKESKDVTRGMDVDVFARRMAHALEKEIEEVVIADFQTKNLLRIRRFFPLYSHRFVRRLFNRRIRY